MTTLSDINTSHDKTPPWKFVLGLMRFRPWTYLALTLAFTSIVLSRLIPGLVVREFMNLLSDEAAANFGFWTLIAFMTVNSVVNITAIYTQISMEIPFFHSSQTLVQKNLLQYILQQPGARALPESSGQTISRFRDDSHEFVDFTQWLIALFANSLYIIAVLAIMLNISSLMTLAVLLPQVAFIIAASVTGSRVKKYRAAARKVSARVTSFIASNFNAIETLKANHSEDRVVRQFAEINNERQKAILKDRLLTEIMASIPQNAANLGIGFLLVVVAQLVQSGAFTVGDFALFVAYSASINKFFRILGAVWARYKHVDVSIGRMRYLLGSEPASTLIAPGPVYLDGTLPEVKHIAKQKSDILHRLEVQGMTYLHPSSGRGIKDIHFTLERGTFTVIVGRIGSGKTTLLRTLLGLLPPDKGQIRWNGAIVDDPASFFVPPRSAYTSQVPRLFSGTLRENILLGLSEEQVDLAQAVHLAVLEQDLEELVRELDTVVGPKGVRLSGGQVQRTAAARMLIHQAELLVFDDLSSALDVNTEKLLWQRLFADSNDQTYLVVSHRRSVLQQADNILVLKDGQLIAAGQLDDLLTNCEEMQHLWIES